MTKGHTYMNLPNKLTLSRIILVPFVVFFYLSSSYIYAGKLIASGIFILGILTDFLDGYIARKKNLVSVLGVFLDNIADKIFVITALILLICDGSIIPPFGAIFAIVIIAREFIVSALRQIAANKNIVIMADMWGKVKTVFQFTDMFLFMIFSFLKDNNFNSSVVYKILGTLCYILLGITVIVTLVSGIHYLVKNKKVF